MLGWGSESPRWGGDGDEVSCTNDSLKSRMAQVHWDLKHADRRLIGSEKVGKKMIGQEQWCQHWVWQRGKHGSVEKNKQEGERPWKQADEWSQIFLNELWHNLHFNTFFFFCHYYLQMHWPQADTKKLPVPTSLSLAYRLCTCRYLIATNVELQTFVEVDGKYFKHLKL